MKNKRRNSYFKNDKREIMCEDENKKNLTFSHMSS